MENKKYLIIAIIVSVVYFVLPIDLIPDFIVGLGQIDDIMVAVISFAMAINKMRSANVE